MDKDVLVSPTKTVALEVIAPISLVQPRTPTPSERSNKLLSKSTEEKEEDDAFPSDIFTTTQFLRTHHHLSHRRVLVHWQQGKSQSVATVMGYIMFVLNMRVEEAKEVVMSKRKEADPNIGFVQVLRECAGGLRKSEF